MAHDNAARVAIAFARVDPDQNPNLRESDGEKQALTYYTSMLVSFSSFRRWNPDLQLVLVSNADLPAHLTPAFDALGVERVLTEFKHCPPTGYAERFNGSLYLLDAMRALDSSATTLFVDPDVLCVAPLGNLLQRTKGRIGALPMAYGPEHDINGLSRRQAAVIHQAMGEPADAPVHYGGEIYVIPPDLLSPLLVRAESAWTFSLARADRGETRFTTEEHVLSFALRGLPICTIEPDARRIWTAARFRTVDGGEASLTLWHLPAEKDRGFARLASAAADHRSWFWEADRSTFVRRTSAAMGISHRPPRRFLKELAGSLARSSGLA